MARRNQDFQTIRSEGGLLPADLLRRVLERSSNLVGTRPEDYGLPAGERLNEVITQSWNRLRKHWVEFREAAANLPSNEAGTGLTNDRWNLPLLREFGFGLLPTSAGPEIEGRTYAISRFFGPVPVHLIGCGLSLDRRAAGQRGAAAANPHGLVQEFLNRSHAHLWALLSNGLRLRVLRDNQALSRQSFLEFDLEAMMGGEVYSDFVLLWLVAHATRFASREGDRPESCWLEQWTQEAEEQGTRALGELRRGVEQALAILGEGFTSHPRNTALRDALRSGQLSPTELHAQLLRLVYRLIFLFVAEDRTLEGQSLLHPRDDTEAARTARDRYATHYGTARLREMAGKIKGSRHGDLWQQFQILVRALSGDADSEGVRQALTLPALGSFLWDPASTLDLNDAELTNFDLLEALRHLAFTRQGKVLRPVDYKNLGAEELGGVYESLLALTPQVSGDGARFSFAEFAGNERKTSGSYYTPDSLVQCLLDSALDPVVEAAIKGKSPAEAEQAILALKVCDPAVGSGHFLVGAAHRLARHLARVRALAEGESEPSPLLYQHALRDVIGRCLYGVDVNPMAAELCRVSLWLEALEPGKPLSFLDHHIRVGNSLLGTTPELIAQGIPDDAFKPIEGDDKQICSQYKKQNKKEREFGDRGLLLQVAEPQTEYDTLASRSQGIDQAPDDSMEAIKRKAEQFRRLVVSPEYRHRQMVADAWCAAFVWTKTTDAPEPITTDTIRRLEENASGLDEAQRAELERLANQYQFFHWKLVFPEVFTGGGFDCMLGNPPWERVKLQEKEWFAECSPEIANAPNAAARKRLIAALKRKDPEMHQRFLDDSRKAEGDSHLLRNSGRYPLCGRGDINLYTVFAEGMRTVLNGTGRAGAVLPTGIATDDTTKFFFRDLVEKHSLVSLLSFENEEFLFPDVHHAMKFCLLTMAGRAVVVASADFIFYARQTKEISDTRRRFSLLPEEIALLNPNTHTCPVFRSRMDAELTKAIYRRVPALVRESQGEAPNENRWGIKFNTMFHMSNDSHLFRTPEQLEDEGWELGRNVFCKEEETYLPLYEAKMVHHFNHRFATYENATQANLNVGSLPQLDSQRLGNPCVSSHSFYWVSKSDVATRLLGKWSGEWLMVFRDITNTTNERTVINTILPRVGVGHTSPLIFPCAADAKQITCLTSNLSAFAFDYLARQKIGGTHLTYGYFNQLPVFPPLNYCRSCDWIGPGRTLGDWLLSRVLELTDSAWDLEPFARDCGWDGPPFRWDEERRFLIRCELDAAFFHLYLPADKAGHWHPARKADGCPYDETPEQLEELKRHFPTPTDAIDYIMDTFPIVRRKDEEKFGEYRTKRVILEIYDAMQEATQTGQLYETRLDPPPGPPMDAHGNFVSYAAIANNPPPHIHAPRGVERLVAADLDTLPDDAWQRPRADQRAESGAQLAAILKAMTGPLPARQVRLAALLALEPRLLLPYLNDEEATRWRRLVGAEAEPLPQGASAFTARNDQAWGSAVRMLRANDHLVEDIKAGTWAPGENLDRFPPSEWADGRARIALDVLQRHSMNSVVTALPDDLKDWVNDVAAA